MSFTPATKKLPAPSLSTPLGPLSCAAVAAPPLPAAPADEPLPAAVSMIPLLEMRRITALPESVISRPPRPSSERPAAASEGKRHVPRKNGEGAERYSRYAPTGDFSAASKASPPSPVHAAVPGIPAHATTVPLAHRRRTAWFDVSTCVERGGGGVGYSGVVVGARLCKVIASSRESGVT